MVRVINCTFRIQMYVNNVNTNNRRQHLHSKSKYNMHTPIARICTIEQTPVDSHIPPPPFLYIQETVMSALLVV